MKTITFKNSIGRYDDVSPFIIADNGLEIKVELPHYNGEFFFIAENNGKTFKKFIPQDGLISLDGLTAGELTAEVKHYVKGNLVQQYKIEPLILRAVDGSLSATPEFADLKAEIAALKEELAQEKQAAERRTEALNEWKQNTERTLNALMKFAFDDYSKNVYLSGGDFAQFCKEYGFEAEEKNLGGNNND